MFQRKVLVYGLIMLAAGGHLTAANNEVETVFKDNEVVPDVISAAPHEFLKVIV